MVFLHPDVKVSSGAEPCKPALERFSEMLRNGDLKELPEPRDGFGPVRKIKAIKKGDPVVKKHAVRLPKWSPGKAEDLKGELDDILLRDVFGLEDPELENSRKCFGKSSGYNKQSFHSPAGTVSSFHTKEYDVVESAKG
jgi:hypothetical protein